MNSVSRVNELADTLGIQWAVFFIFWYVSGLAVAYANHIYTITTDARIEAMGWQILFIGTVLIYLYNRGDK